MSIKEIEKDLQRKDSSVAQREHNKTVYNVWESQKPTKLTEEGMWQKVKDNMSNVRLRAIVVGGIAIFVILFVSLVVISFVYFQSGFFNSDRVTLSVQTPDSIGSNILTEIKFTYNNHNRAKLNNAKIIVQFGDYFIPAENQDNFERISDSQGVIKIGTIRGNSKNTIILAGHFVGPVGSVDDVSGTLYYIPDRTSTKYETQARGTTTITSSPISIDIKASPEVVSGNLVNIAINIKNTSSDVISNLKLMFKAPKSFSMYNSTPNSMDGRVWLIDEVAPQSKQVVYIQGSLNAELGTTQLFDVEVGTQESGNKYVRYAKGRYVPQIIGSPIIIKQRISGVDDKVIYAGERLEYIITFMNNSNVPLSEAIVSVHFDTKVLDFSQLDLNDKGDYNEQDRSITWKASDIAQLQLLKPNESGEISFIIPVLDKLPVNNKSDYNFSVTTLASIDSEDIPFELRENKKVLSNALTKIVGAKVLFKSNVVYKDGVLPPKVGEKTRYTATLTVDSVNNDIEDSEVTIPLPTYIKFINGKDVKFNERTNEVIWTIGNILHGTGIVSDSVKTSFDVEIIPSIDQVGKSPLILQQQILNAKDLFTGVHIKEIGKSITTSDIVNEQNENRSIGEVQA